ncbi:MAG: zinc ribbon domain-containing protein [Candidatus Thorarchaeota archaeon]
MHYERNEYQEGFSICALIIAGIFLWWGFNIILDDMANWWWLFGFLWIIIGLSIISSQIYKLTNRSKLRNIVKQEFEQNPNISIEMIASNTGITVKDARAIVLDLKARGELRGKFSTKTGEAKNVEVTAPNQATPEDSSKYCANCGTPVKREGNAVFCAYCGAKL